MNFKTIFFITFFVKMCESEDRNSYSNNKNEEKYRQRLAKNGITSRDDSIAAYYSSDAHERTWNKQRISDTKLVSNNTQSQFENIYVNGNSPKNKIPDIDGRTSLKGDECPTGYSRADDGTCLEEE